MQDSSILNQSQRRAACAFPACGRFNFVHITQISPFMPIHITKPTIIQAAGNKPKIIEEYIGRVNSKDSAVSIARMKSPSGWVEPGQTPQFDEYTMVLAGMLHVEHRDGAIDVAAGEAIIIRAGEWVRYSTPGSEGAEYIAVCLPAFSPETVRRDS
jgi:mannose-6-phosphate isomerase-like protein (cupin superfamily)